ncbi:MAG: hypothetical protein OXU61_00695, partial [Gammaproteobacteria bacterium]|nr:hypothetical protein [Gammaproteobacteria bacterium]
RRPREPLSPLGTCLGGVGQTEPVLELVKGDITALLLQRHRRPLRKIGHFYFGLTGGAHGGRARGRRGCEKRGGAPSAAMAAAARWEHTRKGTVPSI